MESTSVKKFKVIVSAVQTFPIFHIFFKKRFLRKFNKPGHGSLVLILQVEWVVNFDYIRNNALQVLTYYSFSRSLCYDDAGH